jgi:hypothetical protein
MLLIIAMCVVYQTDTRLFVVDVSVPRECLYPLCICVGAACRSAVRRRRSSVRGDALQELEAWEAAKEGRPVGIQQSEYLAARIYEEAWLSEDCGICHLCCSSPAHEGHMDPSKACKNISNPQDKCLKRLAMLASAVGKEGAIASLQPERSVGWRVKVCCVIVAKHNFLPLLCSTTTDVMPGEHHDRCPDVTC